MSTRQTGTCALCLQTRDLCDSHVLSAFAYKPLFDAKGRFVQFSPTVPNDQRLLQSGYSSYLLCEACEGLRNREYEQPFQREWLDDKALEVLSNKRAGVVSGLNYPAHKLFHLCNLWMAHESPHEVFSCVKLEAAHADRIREMIHTGDAGAAHEYPIMCCVGEVPDGSGKVWDEIIKITPAWISEIAVFNFTFLGCTWIYSLSRVLTPWLDKLCLKANGDLPIVKHQKFFERNLTN